jgi:hypothetical protein
VISKEFTAMFIVLLVLFLFGVTPEETFASSRKKVVENKKNSSSGTTIIYSIWNGNKLKNESVFGNLRDKFVKEQEEEQRREDEENRLGEEEEKNRRRKEGERIMGEDEGRRMKEAEEKDRKDKIIKELDLTSIIKNISREPEIISEVLENIYREPGNIFGKSEITSEGLENKNSPVEGNEKLVENIAIETVGEDSSNFFGKIFSIIMLENSEQFRDLGKTGVWLEPIYRTAKNKTVTAVAYGMQMGINYLTDGEGFGISARFSRHSFREKENELKMNFPALSLRGRLLIGNIFDIRSTVTIGENSFSGDKDLKFIGRSFNFGTDVGFKFTMNNYLQLRPFLGIQISSFSHGDFAEEAANKYSLTMARLGLSIATTASSSLNFNLDLGGKFRISSTSGDPGRETVENLKSMLVLAAGMSYSITKNFSLGVNVNYQGNGDPLAIIDTSLVAIFNYRL